MIYFNGIELDYNSNTLNKIVIKKALTKVESLADRKGTSSTTFDVPRTAHNEKAFGLMTLDGSLFNPTGTAQLFLDGNLYAKGSIKVQGYNDTVFKLLFKGSDIDVIDIFKVTPLKNTVKTSYSNLYAGSYWIYDDVFIKSAMGTVVNGELDYMYNAPQSRALYNASNVVPFFRTSSIINKMFSDLGYTVSSDFMTSDYATYLYYSNFEGKHYSTSLCSNVTNTFTSTSSGALSLGNVILGNSITKTANKYYFVDSVEKIKVGFKVTIAENIEIENVSIKITVTESGVDIIQGQPVILLVGENNIFLESDTPIASGSYMEASCLITLKTGYSLPINFDIDISDVQIQNDNIQEDAVVLINDYLGDLSQLEFLQNYLKFHNLVMYIKNETVYIDCQDDAIISGTSVSALAITEKDITDKIESSTDVSLDYSLNKYIYFEQKMITSSAQTVESLNEVSIAGSVFTNLNTYGEGTEVYSVDFQSIYDTLDGYALSDAVTTDQPSNLMGIPKLYDINKYMVAPNKKVPIGYAETWDNYITINSGTFSGYGTTGTVEYTNMDTTVSTINKLKIQNQLARYKGIGYSGMIHMFKQTLEQKKNNKVREIELYDYSGTLINFRTDYIIDKQIYKLLSYEFEPTSKKVKAKIILK